MAGVLAITFLALCAFDVAAVTEVRGYLVGRTDALLQQVLTISEPRLDALLRRVRSGRKPGILRRDLGQVYLAYIPDAGPTVVFESGPGLTPQLPSDPAAIARDGGPRSVQSADGTHRLRLRATHVAGGTLLVSSDLHDVNVTVAHLRLVVFLGSIAASAVIAAGVVALLRRGLRPLESMAAQADRITAGDLTGLDYPDDPGTEVGRLGAALTGMLARIHAAIAEREQEQDLMRRFFADASHELRTPLASVRANAELYEQGALATRADVDESMRRIGLEARRMSTLVDDMLRLARLAQRPEAHHGAVDLTALVGQCLDRARVAEPDRGWRADVQPGLVIAGDEELLQRAVDNLIANVRAHAGGDAAAALTAARHGDLIRIEVSDTGPGVPAERLPRIFDRFYRAGPQRDGSSGAGLGLAIVAEIAALHGGRVEAEPNRPHGLRVSITLPVAPAPDDEPVTGAGEAARRCARTPADATTDDDGVGDRRAHPDP